MEEILEKYGTLALLYKLLIIIGSCLLITYIFWQYMYKKPAKDLGKAMESVEKLQADLRHHRMLVRNLPQIREEVKLLDAELIQALAELPDKQETSRLLDSISDLATDAGLEVKSFAEQGEKFQEFYGEKSVHLEVNGSYHQIASFFDEVGQMSRIVNINGVSLSQPNISKEGISLGAKCQATTYWYLTEKDRKANQQQTSKKRRR